MNICLNHDAESRRRAKLGTAREASVLGKRARATIFPSPPIRQANLGFTNSASAALFAAQAASSVQPAEASDDASKPGGSLHKVAFQRRPWWLGWLVMLACTTCAASASGQDSLLESEAEAVRAVVARAVPAVVRVELVGVVETVGEVQADAPTVGTVVDPAGWIVASSQVVARPAASILIVHADGSRSTAEVVARDSSREWVLLKTEVDRPLEAIKLPDKVDPQVGQYAIAVGRAAGTQEPAVSVGIVSATGRLNNRFLQTDARVSPSFYGGPLLDIFGNVLGILVPAMPESAGAGDKTGWYDSGIAFAAPADAISRRLESMKAGNDVERGLLGIVAAGADPYAAGTTIDAVRPRSPAARAGLAAGDTIVQIAGVPVEHQYQIKQELGRFDAGDEVAIKVRREDQELELKPKLAASIPPLDLQTAGLYVTAAGDDRDGVLVVAVEPGGPADEAGIQPGDRLVELDGKAISEANRLRSRVSVADPEQPLVWKRVRDGEEQTVELKTRSIAGKLAAVPPRADSEGGDQAEAKWETETLRLPDAANPVFHYAPGADAADEASGLLIVLADPGEEVTSDSLSDWRAEAQRSGVAVAIIGAATEQGWTPPEASVIGKAAARMSRQLGLSRASVAVTGQTRGPSFAMALVAAVTQKESLGGVLSKSDIRPPAIRLRENDVNAPVQVALPIGTDDDLPKWAGILPKIGFSVVRTGDLDQATTLAWVRTLSRI